MSKCEWCDYKDNQWLLHKSTHWSVYLADVQDYVGRCILVSNRHCGSLSELDVSEWMELKTMIDRLESIYREVSDISLKKVRFYDIILSKEGAFMSENKLIDLSFDFAVAIILF